MPALDLKYTDEDVRRDAELQRRAESYASHYEGDFDFLAMARAHMEKRGSLTIGVARGVLNCMRLDPRISDSLPPPDRGQADSVRPHLRVVARVRSVFVKPKVWKRSYLVSIHVSARTIHMVDRMYSGHNYWFEDDKIYNVEVKVRGLCCTSYPRYRLLNSEGVSALLDEGYRICARCENAAASLAID